jgi:hypothetical protein
MFCHRVPNTVWVDCEKGSFREVKEQEARSRMGAIRKTRCSPQAMEEQQRHASLIGNGAKRRITNFKQVAQVMSRLA